MLLREATEAADTKDFREFSIKKEDEEEEQYGIVEVMMEDEEEIASDVSDVFEHRTSKSKSSRRTYKRKKNLDDGLTVVEVDGVKIYQCDICKVSAH